MIRNNFIRLITLIGIPGIYIYLCGRLKKNPAPTKVRVFGIIRTFNEIRNIFDNFGAGGELRNREVESYLSKERAPCVIDCGVNVGVTARWWFHLNRQTKVFGIDMMKEAQEFTIEAIKSMGLGRGRYKGIVATLWSEDGKEFKIMFKDPLLGDNGLYREDIEPNERVFTSKTLDTIFNSENINEVSLLKIDLEVAGGHALKGAAGLLKKTKYVVFETHGEEERSIAGDILTNSKFILTKTTGKHMWWKKCF